MDTKKNFDNGWSFLKTKPGTELQDLSAMENGEREGFVSVRIPHDWLIGQVGDLYENSTGWYRKVFTQKELQSDVEAGDRVIIRFDGIYMDSVIYLNGQKVMEWKYGYSTFDVDLTQNILEACQKGEADFFELLVQVKFLSPNSRWYSGAGIYRHVWVKVCHKVWLPLDETYISIKPAGEKEYHMKVVSLIAGNRKEDIENSSCQISLWKKGELIKRFDDIQGKSQVQTETIIKEPEIWSPESPTCYELVVSLWSDGIKMDEQQWTIGFRTITLSPDEGLILNGEKYKVHGVCEHHDLGCLGAAVYEKAIERRLKILKGMGVNAIRTSHNMPAPELMELADRMGFLIMNEAFDMWERPKTTYDYARFFKEWAIKDVESWIKRDRNHPSLFLWSIGNEIYDTHADEKGQEITRRLIGYVRMWDPEENAAITIGSNYMPWENARKCADIVKVAGYNYAEKYYHDHHKEHPDWIIYGSETASIVQSRGIYHFPLSQSILADEDSQCSALGNSATSWGAKSIEKCITDDRDAEFAFGQFLWTGFDYIGEPTPYHTKNSYFGQIDTAGFPKDSYYIFKAAWSREDAEPFVHLFPYWDFNEGQQIDVRVCTNAAFVELFLKKENCASAYNAEYFGKSFGRQKIDLKNSLKLVADWKIPYEKGVLTAVAYNEAGEIVSIDQRSSFGESRIICLEADKLQLEKGKRDLSFITITMKDKKENPVENAVDYVQVTVEGPGKLLGLDNGDSTDRDEYQTNVRKLFSGKLSAVVMAEDEDGIINVTVSGNGLITARLNLKVGNGKETDGLENEYTQTHVPMLPTPIRKIELSAPYGTKFDADKKELIIQAKVLPANAGVKKLIWKAVNDGGVDIGYATVEELEKEGDIYQAKVTVKGDGNFRIRCMAVEESGKIPLISQLELQADGIGVAMLNPYELIGAGLFSETQGEIGNGNEKGIAFARDGISAVIYKDIDFGPFGSDELTIPLFELGGAYTEIELWMGAPNGEGSRLLQILPYHKKSIWNVYQEETWKLKERISGIQTIGFLMRSKAHMKGFVFKKLEKAFEKLYGKDASNVYGDSFSMEETAICGIGNNVTIIYDEMDFGENGTDQVMICGKTPLSVNTIHIYFTKDDGTKINRIVEFTEGKEWKEMCFSIEKLCGKGTIELVFLPGSNFDLQWLKFIQ